MKRKILFIIMSLIFLTGCKTIHSEIVYYPENPFVSESRIALPHGYDIDRSHPYDFDNTETGLKVTINLITQEDK